MGGELRSLHLGVQHQPHVVLEMPAAAAELSFADTVVPHIQKVRLNSNQDKVSIFSGNEVPKYTRNWALFSVSNVGGCKRSNVHSAVIWKSDYYYLILFLYKEEQHLLMYSCGDISIQKAFYFGILR